MKNVKKILTLVVAVAMLVTVTGAGVFAFSDVQAGSPVYEAANTLNSLGIITGFPDGTFQPEGDVTRAQMAAMLIRAQGLSGMSGQTATAFTDVPATHWASGYIATANSLQIVTGHGGGIFDPEANVTFEQAVTMIMRTIGYSPMATANGGFPVGYMVAAANARVTQGITAAQGAPANRGTVARLIYNALSAPMMIPWGWAPGTGAQTFIIANGVGDAPYRTLLTESFNVSRLRGRVVSNRYTSIVNGVPSIEAIDNSSDMEWTMFVELDTNDSSTDTYVGSGDATIAFRAGDSGIGDMLGLNVIFYVVNESGFSDDRVISAVVDAGRNTVQTFDIEDLEVVLPAFNQLSFSRDGARATNVNLASDVIVIYNGRAVAANQVLDANNPSVFSPNAYSIWGNARANGTITTVAVSGSGNRADLIFVNSARVFVVNTVMTATNVITSRNNAGNLILDLEDDVSFTLTRDGEPVAISSIQPWDVLMVETHHMAMNVSDAGLFNIRVITDTVTGQISGISGSIAQNNLRVTIGSRTFELAVGVFPNAATFSLGLGGRFFIDENGNIAAVDTDYVTDDVGHFRYGFIFATDYDDTNFGATRRPARVEIMLDDGTIQVAGLAPTVSLPRFNLDGGVWRNRTMRGDGTTTTASPTPFFPLANLAVLENQLIRFATNAAGQINSIEIAQSRALNQVGFNVMNRGDEGVFEFISRTNMMQSRTSGVANVAVNPDTLVFFIDFDTQTRRNNSRVGRVSGLADGAILGGVDLSGNLIPNQGVLFFDPNQQNRPAVMVVRNFEVVAPMTTLALFNSAVLMRNNDGEEVTRVSFWQNGQLNEMTTTPDQHMAFDGWARGMAFRYSVNASNEINDVVDVFTATRAVNNVSPTIEVGDGWDEDDIGPGGVVRSYVFDSGSSSTRGSETRLIIAPVVRVDGSTIVLGSDNHADRVGATPLTGFDWTDAFELAIVDTDTNVYVFDAARTGAAQLALGGVHSFSFLMDEWAEIGAAVRRPNQTPHVFAAPALQVRDWVIVVEVDNRATDILVISRRISDSFTAVPD